MTNEELDRLEALAMAATPGPWRDDGYRLRAPVFEGEDPRNGYVLYEYKYTEYPRLNGENGGQFVDAEYIAAMHPGTALALIAELRRLRALETEARALMLARHMSDVQAEASAVVRMTQALGALDALREGA